MPRWRLPQPRAAAWAACTKRHRKALKLLDFLDVQKRIYAKLTPKIQAHDRVTEIGTCLKSRCRFFYVIRQHGDCPKYDRARPKSFKKHLKSPSESAIINLQRVAFLRKSSWRNSHAPFLRNRVRSGKMGENFIGKSCSRNA